jgi:hypothetical protein
MSLSDQLSNLNVAQLKINGKTYEQVLKDETKRLKDCIQKEIDNYYLSYTPIQYQRSYDFQESLTVDDVITINVDASRMEMIIHFNDLAYHDSYWGDQGKVNVALLLDDGWQWKNNPHINHLSEYGGSHFIENAISEFNVSNSLNIKIRLEKTWNGNTYFDDYI